MKSKVMQIANRLVKQGVNRPAAMVRAWILVKLNRLTVKAVVGYLNREIAACIAVLMDGGKTVYSRFRGVTSGEESA